MRKQERIPVLLLPLGTVRRLGRRFTALGRILAHISPKLGSTLSKLGVELDLESYVVGSFFSSIIYAILFSTIAFFAMGLNENIEDPGMMAIAIGFGVWLMFFMLHIIYPKIILTKVATNESKDLLFALREVMLDVNSGIPLFWALKNSASSDYGYVSNDFEWVVRQIESCVSEQDALRQLAIKTESEYLKRAVWQMVNALESGASMGSALSGIVDSVETNTYRTIKNYSSNLNFLMLIYMFAAAVVPSLGVTFLVLLSAFSDLGVSIETVSMLVLGSAIMQVALIGYMGSTRPEIFGG